MNSESFPCNIYRVARSCGVTLSSPSRSSARAPLVHNLNISNGGIYDAVDPLLGPDSGAGNYGGRLADKLIDGDVCDRVILAPMAHSGSSVAQWAAAGVLHGRIAVM